jgi:hypothetical protein
MPRTSKRSTRPFSGCGAQDDGVTADDVHKFEPQTTELGKNIANPDASEEAGSKTIRFLAGTLKNEYPGESRIGTPFSGG